MFNMSIPDFLLTMATGVFLLGLISLSAKISPPWRIKQQKWRKKGSLRMLPDWSGTLLTFSMRSMD
jgi:hypothetical protein